MPALAFLAVAGLVLLALLFVADATLEKAPPPIVTSNRVGLPERWHGDSTQVITTTPAPAPDMTSPTVRAAQPKPDHEGFAKIAPAARAARAEVPPENNHSKQPFGYQQNRSDDRFSIGGQ
jgi:hypothetical protein